MTVRASNLIPSVKAVSPASVGFRPGVTGKTSPVHFLNGKALKGKDLGPIAGVDVSFAGSVTGFTALILPTFGRADFQYLMRILTESEDEVFVAGTARGRGHVTASGRGRRCRGLGS